MAFTLSELESRLTDPSILDSGCPLPSDAQHVFDHAIALLERGEIRAAHKDADGQWQAVPWVKRAILLGFRIGRDGPTGNRGWETCACRRSEKAQR